MTPSDGVHANSAEKLLIVDSDNMLCELLQYKFDNEGFIVDIVHDGETALTFPLDKYDLMLVDLMNRPFNGVRFTRAIRENSDTFGIPVIIMSDRTGEDAIVEAFDAGADDYITKPFSTRVLIARIRSVLRRRKRMTARRLSNVLRYKGITVDFGAGTVLVDENPVSLTRTEYLILAMFMRHRNQFFERSEIQHEAWEEETISERAVDTNISRLRKKLGDYGRQIVNRQGFGYGFIE
ncbi:MAG: response regulator transcription factor [Paramuribaculum sp.]|nr:response regulator transcription factor [Paramuribaculum sp.]